MASKFDDETNQLEDEYCDQDDDDLGDFIVYSDDEDDELSKHKHQRQEELEDGMKEEVEEEVEPVEEVGEAEEEVEVEVEEAPVGQQEILSLREQLKEKIRRKNAAMTAGTCKARCSSSVNQTILPPGKDGYGTFFGPSKPVLARRVIEEGCSSFMKERENVSSRKGAQLVSKVQPGTVENLQKPKFVSEEKRKVDALRENRDYSSLFSDDADNAQPTKEQPDNRTLLLVPKSESHVRGGAMNSAGMSTLPSGQPARLSSKDNASFQARVHRKAGSLGKDSLADRKRMIAAGINGSNLPNMKKKTPGLNPSSNCQKLQPSLQSKRPQASVTSRRQQQPASQGQRMQQQLQSPRPQGNGRQLSLQGRRPDGSVQGQRIVQNGSAQLNGRLKSEQKRLDPYSKLKASHPMDKRAMKRKSDDGMGKYSLMIRKIFNYDPRKFMDGDEDDGNMEADFSSIEKEERRSAALARKEDQEQLRLIQEEERRERAMKKKKLAHKE
ncbi:hypothetical protein GQ55_1G331100 [Panicum hallii var. hallii]|uniref:SPT2 chromatin protein n=1 Tax=Panicum hallii var. hallii TaxID=1504633 RepID=A0A2T7FA39_9POAL|nr:hypothetical protein GQ55_1G331100 [Panicum hallii var. hallii]